jgi:hypothetical protein
MHQKTTIISLLLVISVATLQVTAEPIPVALKRRGDQDDWNDTLSSIFESDQQWSNLEKRERGLINLGMLQAPQGGLNFIPTLDQSSAAIQPNAATSTCLFYTQVGRFSQARIKAWYDCNIASQNADPFTGDSPPRPGVVFLQIIDTPFASTQIDFMDDIDALTFNSPGAAQSMTDPATGQVVWAKGTLDGLLSRAYAERCTGIVYFFTAQRFNGYWYPPVTSVWYQYELPALLQNAGVTHIVQVNPSTGLTIQNNQIVHPISLWNNSFSRAYAVQPRSGYRYISEIDRTRFPDAVTTLVPGQVPG